MRRHLSANRPRRIREKHGYYTWGRAAGGKGTPVNIETIFTETSPSGVPEDQQLDSPLIKLPPELRVEIYQLLAFSQPEVTVDVTGNNVLRVKDGLPQDGLALLRTCKRTRREAYDAVWDTDATRLSKRNGRQKTLILQRSRID